MANPEELKALVTEAIFRSLDSAKRDELIKDALVALMEPKSRGNWDRDRKSDLQMAYEEAIRQIAYEEVRKALVENADVKAKILELVNKAFLAVLSDPSKNSDLVSNMATAIANAFRVKD